MNTPIERSLSKLSYINKDFQSTFNELLELVPNLTNSWDPASSNESDPGVVLVKLIALLQDKLNYNIDKNILEAFPLSVTQYGNAQKIYDILGYSMSWYRSAMTDVTLTYNGDEITSAASVQLAPFQMVQSADGYNVYTLLGDADDDGPGRIVFTESARQQLVTAIEGRVMDLRINGSSIIKLANLDSNRRIYFTEKTVAENGIFVRNARQSNAESDDDSWTAWHAVTNLEAHNLQDRVYKFGVTPDSNVCYIEFPQDIANLIGEGLEIKYIISNGVRGNITAHTLSTFVAAVYDLNQEDSSTPTDLADKIAVTNISAALDGSDPESLEDAYHNYKKTIGTFDTLVSRRDYENAIYNLKDNFNQPLVSNVKVSDRTNDINYSTQIITNDLGIPRRKLAVEIKKDIVGNDTEIEMPMMDAFDLGIYALNPISRVYNETTYNRSFKPLLLNAGRVEELLSDLESAQHNYIDTAYTTEAIDFIFKNMCILNGKLYTYYKVSEVEAREIQKKVREALFKKFNARMVNFGQELNYDELVETIETADTRIKMVALNEPEYVTKLMDSSGEETLLNDANPIIAEKALTLLAKLVLNGTVQLYNFDQAFQYSYDQTSIATYDNIAKITTEASISADSSNPTTYGPLSKNQVIQIVTPSYIEELKYPGYTTYYISQQDNSSKSIAVNNTIPANTQFKVGSDITSITLYWKDPETNNNKSITYDSGEVLRADFDLNLSSSDPAGPSVDNPNIVVPQSKYIYLLKQNAVEFNSSNFNLGLLDCYWITNRKKDGNYILFGANETEIMLDTNEYFIYTDKQRLSLVLVSSGTTLKRSKRSDNVLLEEIKVAPKMSLTDINNYGADMLEDIDAWYHWDLNEINLTIEENQINRFGEGASISTETPLSSSINNTPITYTGKIIAKVNESEQILPYNTYEIRSRLQLVSWPGETIVLGSNDYVNFWDADDNRLTTEPGITSCNLQFNSIMNIFGGTNIDAAITAEDSTRSYTLQALTYNLGEIASTNAEVEVTDIPNNKVILVTTKNLSAARTLTLPFSFSKATGKKAIIKVEKPQSNKDLAVKLTVSFPASDSTASTTIGASEPAGIYNLEVTDLPVVNSGNITITFTPTALGDNTKTTDGQWIIHYPQIYTGYSDQLDKTIEQMQPVKNSTDTGTHPVTAADVIRKISALDPNNFFDESYIVPETDLIDSTNVLSAAAFFDQNNPFSKWTLPQLDTSAINITVAATSKK